MTIADSRFVAPPIGEWDLWPDWACQVPAAAAMHLRCSEVGPGHAVLHLEDSVWPLNPNGATHGGLVAAAADHSGGVAAISVLGAAGLPATATLTGEFLRPAFGPLRFEARVVKAGRSLVFVRVDVTNRDGALCTTFTGTWSPMGSAPTRTSTESV
ncbi:PaaI family thioesterase [Nocardia sp. NPDC059236]